MDLDVNVYTIDTDVHTLWQSVDFSELECKLKVVIFSCEDVPKEDTLAKLQTELIGPYLAYKRDIDSKINICHIGQDDRVEQKEAI